ncbi:hypothetical protein DRQ25_17740 [Candidatus Fermentibacteria bacterium]|nr:MAG: hypothetical protein DRQ25_17740 [Candidatus Fermentibacteria bacterium]
MTKEIIITKSEAIGMFRTTGGLAKALGIRSQAVSQWADDKPIPQVQAMKIRYQLRPELFAA